MSNNELLIAGNQKSTVDQLRELMNKTHQINRLIAVHCNADAEMLSEMCEFWGESDDAKDVKVIEAVVKNPNVSIDTLLCYGRDFPNSVLKNLSFDKFLKMKPNLYKDIPEILSTPGCPVKQMELAVKQGDIRYIAYILLNPELPESITKKVSADAVFGAAQLKLSKLIEKTDDLKAKQYLKTYADTSREFCVPRFLNFERDNPLHRLEDQVLFGFPFTSAKWFWPIGANGRHMHPIAQVNLDNASKLIGQDFGSGIFQLWGGVDTSLGVNLHRIIPNVDLSDELDFQYPTDAPWLSVDYTGSPELDDCIISPFSFEDYRPFSIDRCRVEWISLGRMFYPSLTKRIFSPLNQDSQADDCDDSPESWKFVEKLDKQLDKLNLPNGLSPIISPIFLLGGYGDGLGNTWYPDAGSMLLYHSIDSGVKITLAVYGKHDEAGKMVLSVKDNCDR